MGGPLHSQRFWGENYMHFGEGSKYGEDFYAVKRLADLLFDAKSTPETLAVVCHDIGEFVVLHPQGKYFVQKHQPVIGKTIKDKILDLINEKSETAQNREVRREALLACQKIMLNKWQDVAAK